MARRKKGSRTLNRADKRRASVQSIDFQFDLGDGVTADAYITMIAEVREKLAAYNRVLSTVDQLYGQFLDAERKLADFSEKVLLGVAYKYGKDSEEYEMAGGVRKSKRKHPARTVPTVEATT
jgi:hypothetical protein